MISKLLKVNNYFVININGKVHLFGDEGSIKEGIRSLLGFNKCTKKSVMSPRLLFLTTLSFYMFSTGFYLNSFDLNLMNSLFYFLYIFCIWDFLQVLMYKYGHKCRYFICNKSSKNVNGHCRGDPNFSRKSCT